VTVFWLLVALLTLIALIFIVPPLLSRPRMAGVRNDELNVQVIRDQLTELRADLETGRLDQAAYDAARHDLQRELLEDVNDDAAGTTSASSDSARRGRWLIAPLVVLVPLLAVLIYQQIGAQAVIQRLAAGTAEAPVAPAGGQPSMDSLVAKLAERMQQEPDNLEGWALLGRSYASMDRFKEAVEAYQHALKLDGKDPELLSSYADVLVMAHNGEFTDQVGDLLNQALAVEPNHLKSLWLRGHWRFRHSDYSGAIEDWQAVMQALPPDDEKVVMIKRQINAAKSRLGEPVEEVAVASKPAELPVATSGATAIQVQVSLDPALKDKAAADDTVFIFARAVQGPRMPLAIVRKRVADLPVSVTLDDSLAMSPAMVLSKFSQVLVGARVSKTGQAMPASGDLQGQVSPVDTQGGSDIQLTIDSVVP
jgi:cytochrome c-type biogenesis protein CcmH